MKYKKRIAKLQERIKSYEQTMKNVAGTQGEKGFHKPGSKNK